MRTSLFILVVAVLFLLMLDALVVAQQLNPYNVLGLKRTASSADIKKAYKSLAKQFHPDKNSEASAADKFRQVSDAYDILSDDKKKREYDMFGTTSGSTNTNNNARMNPFNAFFTAQSTRFNAYKTNAGEFALDGRINKLTTENYAFMVQQHIRTQSNTAEVWLVYVYGDSCPLCHHVSGELEQAIDEITAAGIRGVVRFGRIHNDFEQALVRSLSIRQLPYIFTLTYNGKETVTRHMTIRAVTGHQDIVQHVAQSFASTIFLLNSVSSYTPQQQRAMPIMSLMTAKISADRSAANKPHVYIFSYDSAPSLAAHYASDYHSQSLQFYFVSIPNLLSSPQRPTTDQLAAVFGIKPAALQRPERTDVVFVWSMHQNYIPQFIALPAQDAALWAEVLERHKFALIPRISGETFYDLCLATTRVSSTLAAIGELQSHVQKRKLCLIVIAQSQSAANEVASLIINKHTETDEAVATTKRAAVDVIISTNMQVAWVDALTQPAFVSHFAALWRKRHPGAVNVTAIVLEGRTGYFHAHAGHMTSSALADWLEEAMSDRSKWLPSVLADGGAPWPLHDTKTPYWTRLLDLLPTRLIPTISAAASSVWSLTSSNSGSLIWFVIIAAMFLFSRLVKVTVL